MTRQITMDLLINVLGQPKVTALQTTLQRLGAQYNVNNMLVQHGRELNTAQTNSLIKQNVALQARLKSGQLSITQLATELNLNEALTQQWEHKLAVEQRALAIKQQMLEASMPYARYLANEQIIVDKNSEAHFNNMRMLQMKRREILASTMAIFGMTMSIWQMTNALSALSGENEEIKKDMKTLQAVMMGATGPLLLFHGIVQLTTMGVNRLGRSMMLLLPASFAIAAAYMAMTSSSKELRMIFGALSGMLTALTIKQIAHTIAVRMDSAAIGQNTMQKIINYAVSSLGAALPVLAGAIVGALAVNAMVPSGQTAPGQYRRMEESGFFYGHKGEAFGRISEPMEGGTGGRVTVEVPIYLDGEIITRAVASNIEKEDFVG